MRANTEDNKAFNQHFQSGRFSHSRRVMEGDVELTVNGSLVNFFDANGANRNVTLPTLENGRFYVVGNVGAANDVAVLDVNDVLVTTVLPGDTALMFASDDEWVALRGWAALGVFTNTVNGLVPAPNSVTPGSLFLRDDGEWAQVQVTGIVDAFKFITDGTNTAIGSGPDTFYLRSSDGSIAITVTNGELVYGDNANFSVVEGNVDHNALLNYVADRHVAHSAITLTAGNGLSGGGTIDASRSFALDLSDLTSDTPVLADTFAFYDVSGTDTNKATLTVLNGILDHNALLNYVANRHIDHSGVSIVAGAGLTGGGTIETSRTINLDFNALTADTVAAADVFPFYDVSGADHNKITFANLNASIDHNALLNYVADQHVAHGGVTLTAGAGLTGGGTIAASRTFAVGAGVGITVNADDVALNINGLTADTLAVGDFFAFYDISGADHNKVTLANLNAALDHNALTNYVANQHIDHTTVSISTTEGIQGGGTIAATRTLKLDINGLAADASPDSANDYIVTYDASAALHKKVLLSNLPSGGGAVIYTGAQSLTSTQRAQARTNISAPLKGHLFGLTLSTVGGSSGFDIAAGECADSTGVDLMVLGSAYNKTTAAWSVGGTSQGALDTGTIAAATWYHVFLIKRPDTGVVDVLVSLNVGAPNLPANYTLFRRIGSMFTVAGVVWVRFFQNGDEFKWSTTVLDINVTSAGTSGVLRTLSVPTSLVTEAMVSVRIDAASGEAVYLSDPAIPDAAPGVYSMGTAHTNITTSLRCRTNISAQIRTRQAVGGATETLRINTVGWIDRRGQDA